MRVRRRHTCHDRSTTRDSSYCTRRRYSPRGTGTLRWRGNDRGSDNFRDTNVEHMLYLSIPADSGTHRVCKYHDHCNRHARYRWRWSKLHPSNLRYIGTSHSVRVDLSGKRPCHHRFCSQQLDSTLVGRGHLASPACMCIHPRGTRHFRRSLEDRSAYRSRRHRIHDCICMFRLHNGHVVDISLCTKARHKQVRSIDPYNGT